MTRAHRPILAAAVLLVGLASSASGQFAHDPATGRYYLRTPSAANFATARTQAPDLNVLSFVDPDRSVTRAMHEIGVAAARDVFRPRRTLVALVGVSPSAALQVRGSNQAAGGRAILTFAGEDEAIAYIVRQRGASAGGLADVG